MQRYSNLRHVKTLLQARQRRSLSDLPRKQRKESHYKSLCKLTLIGRTGSSPELREYEDRKAMTLSVATNSWNGETQWHNVSVSEEVPGFDFLQQLPVGAQVYVEGNMRLNNFTRDDGVEKTYVNVSVYPGMGMFRVLRFPGSSNVPDANDLPF